MTPIPGKPFDPALIEGLPQAITNRIQLTEEGTMAFVYGAGPEREFIGMVSSYTEALRLLVKDKDEGIGRDITHLVLKTAAEMEHKLLKSELKRDTGGVWRNTMWYDELKEELLKHVYKGDPVDVLIYCAFAIYHGWDIRPAHPSYPVKIDPTPLLSQHYDTSTEMGRIRTDLDNFNRLLKVWGTENEPTPNTPRSALVAQVSRMSLALFRLGRSALQLHVIPEPPVRHIDLTDKV